MSVAKKTLLAFLASGCLLSCNGARRCITDTDCTRDEHCSAEGFCAASKVDGGSAGGAAAGGAGGGVSSGGGEGGGSASSSGGGVGGGSTGGGGVAVDELTSLSFVSPKEGATTKETTMALKLEAKPVGVTGKVVTYAASLVDGGGAKTGPMTADAGNVYEATLSGLTEGEWTVAASSGTLKSSVKFVVDRTPPSIKVVMDPAPTRVVDGGLSEVDPATGYAQAFRRDEVGELRVLVSEVLNIASSQFTGVPESALTTKTCNGACDAGHCKCYGVDMSQVTIPDPGFRGELRLGLKNVTDDVGNVAPEASVNFKVTRWKWRKDIAPYTQVVTTPAVDTVGRVYVGASFAISAGTILGLNPNGSQNFNLASYGSALAAPVIGRNVYFATHDNNATGIRMVDPLNGSSPRLACSNSTKPGFGNLVVFGLGEADDRVVTVSGDQWLTAARPSSAVNDCPSRVQLQTVGGFSAVVGVDEGVYVGGYGDDWRIWAMRWGEPWTPAGSNTSHNLYTSGLAIFGGTLGGGGAGIEGGVGGVFAFDRNTFAGALPARFVLDGGFPSATGPVILRTSSAWVFFYGTGNNLVRVEYAEGKPGVFRNEAVAKTPTNFEIAQTPVIGGGGVVYVADWFGTVSAYSSDLTQLKWRLTAAVDGGIKTEGGNAALNIDVARTVSGAKDCSKPGTLYVPAAVDHSLYAFIVDSKGIDATAPWPRFQHDPRNTGNPEVPLSDFSCP